MDKFVKTNQLFNCTTPYLSPLFDKHKYPWEILPLIKNYILYLIDNELQGFKEISKNVFIGKDVKIYPTATIEGPAIIGDGTEIRPGAFLRGNIITGKDCIIGNSTELKNCIMLDKVQVPHYNYVGDSILGNFAHMGAGSICSNLKSDGKNVVVHGEIDYETGLRKMGAILADKADIGCGVVLNPGTIVGKNTSIYPLVPVRGVIPDNCIVKDKNTIVSKY